MPRLRHASLRLCVGVVLGLRACGAGAQPAEPLAEPVRLIADVLVNGQSHPTSAPVLRVGPRLLFPRDALQAWRFQLPPVALRFEGTDYFDPTVMAGVALAWDEATQSATLQAPATAYLPNTQVATLPAGPVQSPTALAALLNYDLVLQHDPRGARASGLFDAAVSGDWGLLTQTLVAGTPVTGLRPQRITRLDTTYRFDDPARLTRLSVGDGITQGAAWAGPVRFGGVQFGTQFGLRPDFVSYPTPTVRGGSAVPSALEVYVNDTLRYQGHVDAGPFAVRDVPVLTGAGEMRFTVTDAMGMRRTVSAPYIVSSSLLRQGLSDYSVELGWSRLRYGENSFDYGRPLASGSWRLGLSDVVTLETHAQGNARSQTAGGGVAWVWNPVGEFAAHAAISRSAESGFGHLGRISFTRSANSWNFSAVHQVASAGFTQLAWQDNALNTRAQSQVFAGYTLGRLGTVGLGYTRLRQDAGEGVRIVTASWSTALPCSAWLSLQAARSQQNGQRAVTTLGLSFTLAFGERQSASLSVQHGDRRTSAMAQVNQSTPSDGGLGYRLLTATGQARRSEAEVQWLGRSGEVAAEAVQADGQTGLRLRAAGSIGLTQGLGFAARVSRDALALVTIPGAANVTVYRDNQPWVRTDSQGRAIVTGLRAYEANAISIDPGDIAIDRRLGREVIQVVPRHRAVALAQFEVAPASRTQLLTVRLPDGSFLPPGIDVFRGDEAEALISGFGGALAVESARIGERFEARWRRNRCSFILADAPVHSDRAIETTCVARADIR